MRRHTPYIDRMPLGSSSTMARAIRVLSLRPLRAGDLAAELGITRRPAERLLSTIREHWIVETEERGRERWHRVIGPRPDKRPIRDS